MYRSPHCTGPLKFLLKWRGCNEFDLVLASDVNVKSPHSVIEFYEQRCMLNRKCEQRRRIQEQYELDLIEYPPAEDVVVEIDAEDDKPTDSTVNETQETEDVADANTSTATNVNLDESMSVAEMSSAELSTADFTKLNESNTSTDQNEENAEAAVTIEEEDTRAQTVPESTPNTISGYTDEPFQQTQAIPDDIEMPNPDDY